ncbi:hypothetical protein [Cognaticolwellia mytili]|uniref:hypothetical protein n=1 Tax=Cognaticolwellia mytili TaxID=1888913 RepID=UPI000A170DD4|nr:hypothetical protein [Cognaticolwellia mytili]
MHIKLKPLFIPLTLLFCSLSVFALPQNNDVSAEQIMTSLESVYSKSNSYSDSGLVKTTFFTEDGARVSGRPFATDFIRSKNFRFEFASKHPFPFATLDRTIIVKNENGVFQWRNHDLGEDKKGIHEENSLGLAIAGATGISGGSAYRMPSLLGVKGVGGWKKKLTDYNEILRIEDGLLNGETYYRINAIYQGKKDKTKSIVLWINKTTYLIHRIDSKHQFPKFRTESTTTYSPSVNIDIKNSRFILNNDM